jgi:hypothetical protein
MLPASDVMALVEALLRAAREEIADTMILRNFQRRVLLLLPCREEGE